MTLGLQTTGTQAIQETATNAAAAIAKASIEARWMVAMHSPRDMDTVRDAILRECKRPVFADMARYTLPYGEGVTGLSIRFVEQALQAMGHIQTTARTIFDDSMRRIVEIEVVDFQRGVSHAKQITIIKTVERRYLKAGEVAISVRQNSQGKDTFTRLATDDEIAIKEASLVSKAVRTCGMRLIPGWLQEEADQMIVQTLANRSAQDPDADRRKLVDAFSTLNVRPSDLAEYLGHDVAKVSPRDLAELRGVYSAIKDSLATWQEVIAHRRDVEAVDDKPASDAPTTSAWSIDSYANVAAPIHIAMGLPTCSLEQAKTHADQLGAIRQELGAPPKFIDETAAELLEKIQAEYDGNS